MVFRRIGKVCVMKKSDFIVIGCVIVCLLPFFVSDSVYSFYKTFNAEHGMIMSFLKFAILSTLGECIGLRISAGVYNRKGFGIWPRAIVWGFLGMGISMAMTIFSSGVPVFLNNPQNLRVSVRLNWKLFSRTGPKLAERRESRRTRNKLEYIKP